MNIQKRKIQFLIGSTCNLFKSQISSAVVLAHHRAVIRIDVFHVLEWLDAEWEEPKAGETERPCERREEEEEGNLGGLFE